MKTGRKETQELRVEIRGGRWLLYVMLGNRRQEIVIGDLRVIKADKKRR
jgi:hypothetical protein